MLKLHKKHLLKGTKMCKLELCKFCVLEKQNRVQFKTATHKTNGFLDYVHYDVWGLVKTTSQGEHMYFIIFIDDFSRKVWVYFMQHKSKTFANFKLWKAEMKNQTKNKVKCLMTNNGIKYTNDDFRDFCEQHGIKRHFTVRKTLHQNGVAEMMNRSIAKRAQCLKLNVGLANIF